MDLLLVDQSIEVEDEEAGAGFVTEEGEEDISSLFADELYAKVEYARIASGGSVHNFRFCSAKAAVSNVGM